MFLRCTNVDYCTVDFVVIVSGSASLSIPIGRADGMPTDRSLLTLTVDSESATTMTRRADGARTVHVF